MATLISPSVGVLLSLFTAQTSHSIAIVILFAQITTVSVGISDVQAQLVLSCAGEVGYLSALMSGVTVTSVLDISNVFTKRW